MTTYIVFLSTYKMELVFFKLKLYKYFKSLHFFTETKKYNTLVFWKPFR